MTFLSAENVSPEYPKVKEQNSPAVITEGSRHNKNYSRLTRLVMSGQKNRTIKESRGKEKKKEWGGLSA
jgi:hypothetical protein